MPPRAPARPRILLRATLVALAALAAVLLYRARVVRIPPAPAPTISLGSDLVGPALALSAYVKIETTDPPGPAQLEDPPHVRFLLDRYAIPLRLDAARLPGNVLAIRVPSPSPADAARRPLVLLSHADTVPVDAPDAWTHGPFSGDVDPGAAGYVWGRGTLDDKGATICALEAVRMLMAEGKAPGRDLVVLVGADEETTGALGIGRLAKEPPAWLSDPWLVLDEGGCMLSDLLPGRVVAAVGVAERGFAVASLRARGKGGHASMPTGDSAVDILARALARLSTWRDEPNLIAPIATSLDRLADASPLGQRILLKNRWLFWPLIRAGLDRKATSAALIRSTEAITIVKAGVKDNVIPAVAEATLNLRLLPGETRERFGKRLRAAISDPRVEMTIEGDDGPAAVTDCEGPQFLALEAVLRANSSAADRIVTIPIVTPATTDARAFAARGAPVLRFLPFLLDTGETARIHGTDERVSKANLAYAVRVYADLIALPVTGLFRSRSP